MQKRAERTFLLTLQRDKQIKYYTQLNKQLKHEDIIK